MIVVDTSGLVAYFDTSDPYHEAVSIELARPQRRILSPFVLAELDFLVSQFAGLEVALSLLNDVAQGAYELAPFSREDVAAARATIARYADLGIGLADASLVVLADRHGCYDILTLDQRHFRALTSPSGRSFRLLPMDDGAPG